jgi:hypothetical protein
MNAAQNNIRTKGGSGLSEERLCRRPKAGRKALSIIVLLATALCSWAGGVYSPGADPNLLTWFKADSLDLTNNARVSIWNPSGGSMGVAVGQSVSSNRPIFQTAQQNGLPAVLFDGATGYLTNIAPFTIAQQPVTLFLVYQHVGPVTGMEHSFLGSTPHASSWWVGDRQGTNVACAGTFGTAVPVDQFWHTIMYVMNGANSKYQIDGGAETPIAGNPGTDGIDSLEFGGQIGNEFLANLFMGEVLIYNGDQSANETAIYGYLHSRWTIIPWQRPSFTLNWPDRRPIGRDMTAGVSASSLTNPRGWFNQPTANYVSVGGFAQFGADMLNRAAAEVQILTNMNAQGVVIWCPEGCELPESYIGDPRLIPYLAPEMDAVADQVFAIFRNAGLRVGVCLRAHDLTAGASLPAVATNGQVFILTNAPFGQKSYYYTNGWIQTNGNCVTAQSYTDLLAKVQYANSRWGCTLFYIDSMGEIDNWGPIAVSACTNIMNVYTNVLLMPESAFLGYGATNMYAMCAPYISPLYEGYFIPTNVPPLYPKAFGALLIEPPYTNVTSIVASIRAGNIMIFDSWYPNVQSPIIQNAYIGAALEPPTDLHVLTNAP